VNNSQIPKIEKTEGAINSEQFGDIGKEKTEGAINNEQFRDIEQEKTEMAINNEQFSLRFCLFLSLDCSLLIAPSVFSVPCVSELFIIDCRFGFLCCL
jgi:hypothetical protein